MNFSISLKKRRPIDGLTFNKLRDAVKLLVDEVVPDSLVRERVFSSMKK